MEHSKHEATIFRPHLGRTPGPRPKTATGNASQIRMLVWLGIAALFFAWAPNLAGAGFGHYVCWMLEDAIEDLRGQGLNVIYSSDVVGRDMQVIDAPATSDPRRALEELLAPFGLIAQEVAADTVLVVRASGSARVAEPVPTASRTPQAAEEGVLPIWASGSEVVEWRAVDGVPQDPVLGSDGRFLIIEVDAEPDAEPGIGVDPGSAGSVRERAFVLKNRILAARATAPGLLVALRGDASDLEAVVAEGLAPYVDGYLDLDTATLAADPTGRAWRRTSARGPALLRQLLAADDRGDQLVILDGVSLSLLEHAFLRAIQSAPIANLAVQPEVFGIDARQVHFFLRPDSDDYYLAVYASPEGDDIRFTLPRPQEPKLVFPYGASFTFDSFTGGSELRLDGRFPFYLFALSLADGETITGDVLVHDRKWVDPYEEVVENQVFQRAQLERFESLDVMEYLSITGHFPGGDHAQWEHRIIQRRGKLTDYHHLGLRINGVPYPTKKLLKGRIGRSEALLQLQPLEVELDETYRYTYLGDETVSGRPTYKIAFEPLPEAVAETGGFVSGVVWLDQETHVHHKLLARQQGVDTTLINNERTYEYEWIRSGGQCFWDWRRRTGTSAHNALGQVVSFSTETVREDFRYNRDDIEQVVQDAYASDTLIHVETPPHGHRWLVKDREGRRALNSNPAPDGALVAWEATDPVTASAEAVATLGDGSIAAEVEADAGYGERTLAPIHAYAKHVSLSLAGFDSGEGAADFFPGIVFTDDDFLRRGYQAYAGFFLREGNLGLSIPNLLGKGWALSAFLFVPYSDELQRQTVPTPEGLADTSLRLRQQSLTLSLGIPLAKRTSLTFGYRVENLGFAATDETDPAFLSPSGTSQHSLEASIDQRWRHFAAEVGFEVGKRADWQPWGLDGGETLHDTFQVARASLGGFWSFDQQKLSASVGLIEGFDLDRFSRLRDGFARGSLPGFRNGTGFDRAALANVTWGTRLLKTPVNLRLDGIREWVDDDEAIERVGVSFRFLVNGPFKLDLWPSIRYRIYSTIADESDEIAIGLFISRRQ